MTRLNWDDTKEPTTLNDLFDCSRYDGDDDEMRD